MNDEQKTPTGGAGSTEAWREVGKQFETLGHTLADAVRTSWYSEDNRKRLQEMQGGLESMTKQVSQAIKETAANPSAEQVKEQAVKAAQTARTAGEQTIQEIRPHLVNALHQLNQELEKLVKRMEEEKATNDKQGQPPAGGLR
ncbi:MAG: hypothetical protein WCF84_13940 [Anaerolineae bacterium]